MGRLLNSRKEFFYEMEAKMLKDRNLEDTIIGYNNKNNNIPCSILINS